MQKIVVVSFMTIVLVLVAAFILFDKSQTPKTSIKTPTSTPFIQEEKVNINASFTIVTDNITRSFKAEKYHNRSSNVYIESVDSTIVHVKKSGITWDDFFKTLPMKLTKDCLITGDGETFCVGANGTLKFYLNNIETPNFLDKEIRDGDKLLINFNSFFI